jgi:hypothetical protein
MVKPVNDVSEDDINNFLEAVRNFDGYPKLRDLGKMLPYLTPLQINVILKYLQRSRLIEVDLEGYIIWVRRDKQDSMTLGESAKMSSELRDYLEKDGQ